MNNYEYITASLPDLAASCPEDLEAVRAKVEEQLSQKDAALLDLLFRAPEESLYREASSSRSRFVREYFDFDRAVRNTKASFFGAPMLLLDEDEETAQTCGEALEILKNPDIVEREKQLDSLLDAKAADLSVLEVFSLDGILSVFARLKTAHRWASLDPGEGRRRLDNLLKEIRQTYDNR